MRKIEISKRGVKFLDTLPEKQFKQIYSKIKSLQTDPMPNDYAKLKFAEYDFYRVDIGEYRIIYSFNAETTHVYHIGKRNDGEVYKKFLRKFL